MSQLFPRTSSSPVSQGLAEMETRIIREGTDIEEQVRRIRTAQQRRAKLAKEKEKLPMREMETQTEIQRAEMGTQMEQDEVNIEELRSFESSLSSDGLRTFRRGQKKGVWMGQNLIQFHLIYMTEEELLLMCALLDFKPKNNKGGGLRGAFHDDGRKVRGGFEYYNNKYQLVKLIRSEFRGRENELISAYKYMRLKQGEDEEDLKFLDADIEPLEDTEENEKIFNEYSKKKPDTKQTALTVRKQFDDIREYFLYIVGKYLDGKFSTDLLMREGLKYTEDKVLETYRGIKERFNKVKYSDVIN